jgi:hypothetical protein
MLDWRQRSSNPELIQYVTRRTVDTKTNWSLVQQNKTKIKQEKGNLIFVTTTHHSFKKTVCISVYKLSLLTNF